MWEYVAYESWEKDHMIKVESPRIMDYLPSHLISPKGSPLEKYFPLYMKG